MFIAVHSSNHHFFASQRSHRVFMAAPTFAGEGKGYPMLAIHSPLQGCEVLQVPTVYPNGSHKKEETLQSKG